MKIIQQGEVKYVTCLYSTQKIALEGERGNVNKSDPIFQIGFDDQIREFQIKISQLRSAPMRSSSAKARADIYFVKLGALQFQKGLEDLLNYVTTTNIILDRGDRTPRDPKANYGNQGLPLEIDQLGAWVKANSVFVTFMPVNHNIECIRQGQTTTSMPRINIEVEKASSRLHLGIEIDWVTSQNISDNECSIIINTPYEECGHLLASVNSAIPKIK